MTNRFAFLIIFLLLPSSVSAQDTSPREEGNKGKPIQDNSFLIEEAYNQEEGVVQHINSFVRQHNGDWTYAFTQEWPWRGLKHQLSVTLPFQRPGDPQGDRGLGDVALNYRYQLLGNGDARVSIAPRVTLLLPTGDAQKRLGAGGTGLQLNLPVSIRISNHVVTHWNAGLTYTPSAQNIRGEKAGIKDYNLGQSVIWLASTNFNMLMEFLWTSQQSVAGPNLRVHSSSFLISPGIRWAYNFKSGLQIVPGLAMPLGVGGSSAGRGIFVYLSFEHPFKKHPK